MKDGIKIKTSMATIDINLTANDEQTLNMIRDSLIGWYEGFCVDCLDNGISCETTFSREETHKSEVKQTETAKTRKHVYDMFEHFKAVTTTECKECEECAKAAADYVINLEEKIKELGDYIDDVEMSQMNDRDDLCNVMKEIGLITKYLDTVVGQYTDYRTSMLRGDSN